MDIDELTRTWGFAVLGGALLLVALLVNRFARHKRYRLRQALLLYVLFSAAAAASYVMQYVRSPTVEVWGEHVRLFADLFSAFTVVNTISGLSLPVSEARRASVVRRCARMPPCGETRS